MNHVSSKKRLVKITEQTEFGVSKIIVKLFKILNEEKKKHKTRSELLESIKKYAPYFSIPKGYERYIMEIYLLNFRKDGDYSSLTKDNFIDPRKFKGKTTTNSEANLYTIAQLPFKASNLEGYWKTDNKGNEYYVVTSYGWYPVYIYKYGKWYETADRYSSSTSKQMSRANPIGYDSNLASNVFLLTSDEMKMIQSGMSHQEVMKKKRDKLKEIEPELKSKRISREKTSGSYGQDDRQRIPPLSIKFKINSVENTDDKSIVNIDIYDVFKDKNGEPKNYLKGEIPNVTPKVIEDELTKRLRRDFKKYLGPIVKSDEENIRFNFNHLKK